jgi:D-beta-D-heptose 7-phosphate kinase/D-beta-D-heptose 1-phosphate adenosyltransferase
MLEAGKSAADIVARLAGARVLIAGDLILDHFVHGEIERISPEAPVPILLGGATLSMLGGAGNVAANVRSLGGEPRLVALIGDDPEAVRIRTLCEAEGVPTTWLVADPARKSAVKTRFISHGQQVLRFDSETVGAPDAAHAERLLKAFDKALADCDAVVLSDYGKGVLLGGAAQAMIRRARAAGKLVLVDPKGADYSPYAGASYLTPNRKELREASNLPVDGDANVVAAARILIARHGVEGVIATRSEQGMSVVTATSAVHIPTVAQAVFDVSGAGDTVVASLALALASGLSVEDAAIVSNAAAGVAVAKLGTAQVTAEELSAALHGPEAPAAAPLALTDARRQVLAWKASGLKVGFTNGCFDLIHPGHIALLTAARAACDRLVVALNTDASVRRLGKGDERPINDQQARATVMAALRPVDLVMLFDEDTPLEAIKALMPDVLIKGADYTVDQIVGADVVLAAGGRVERVGLIEGQSTSSIVAKLKQH